MYTSLWKGLESCCEIKHLFNLALSQILKITELFFKLTAKEESLGNPAPRQIGQNQVDQQNNLIPVTTWSCPAALPHPGLGNIGLKEFLLLS